MRVLATGFESFVRHMSKESASAAELLARQATRKGLRPSLLPAIKQVGFAAEKDRGRAAVIAQNVRKHLKTAA